MVEEWAKREKDKDMGMEKLEPALRAIQWEKATLETPNAFKGWISDPQTLWEVDETHREKMVSRRSIEAVKSSK